MKPPRISTRDVVYEDRYQQIYRVLADFDDSKKEYFVRDSGSRAGVLVIKDDSLLLIRQYRLLINGLSWEIPGGKIETGETPESAAVRECFEETGVQCGFLKKLVFYHIGLDSTYNPTHLFYTNDFVQTSQVASDPQEVIDHTWVPLSTCIKMIFNQEIVDSFTIIALLAYQTLEPQKSP